MDRSARRRLAEEVLDGYTHGPDATVAACAKASDAAESARCIVLVEGVSDQIALDTLATRQGRDLGNEGVVILPIGGAQAAARFVSRFGPQGARARLVGLFDVGEERFVRRALDVGGLSAPNTRRDLERLGFFVCVPDLEAELVRASGPGTIEQMLQSQGDLRSFRVMQRQPSWRDAPFDAQMHRWLRAGAGRSLRYARLLVDVLEIERVPRPLTRVLAAAS